VDDNAPPASYAESAWFRSYQAGFLAVMLGGGVLMLLGAALAHGSASIPLLIFGSWWTVIAIAGMTLARRRFRVVRLDGEMVTFISPARVLTIPAAEIVEVRHAWGDPNRRSGLKVITSCHGTLRISPRLKGMIDLLVQLRMANPALRVDNL
jgi:hypothetical protein